MDKVCERCGKAGIEKGAKDMAKESKTGSCRFCGQSVIIDGGASMTEPQLEEAATMRCECEKATEYQESANRRTVAKQRVGELFGEEAGQFKQPEEVQEIILNAVDTICDKKMKAAVVTIRKGLKAKVSRMANDKIKVTREVSDNDEFVQ